MAQVHADIRAYFRRKGGDSVIVEEVIAAGPKETLPSGAMYWPLPPALWGPFTDADPATGLGPCACPYCSPDGESKPAGAWDCLAWRPHGEALLRVWRCHHPQLRGVRKKRR